MSTSTDHRDTAASAVERSRTPVPIRPDRTDLIVTVPDPVIGPTVDRGGVSVWGDPAGVTDPTALLDPGTGPTVLRTRAARSTTLVVDLGHVVMGRVVISVRRAAGGPIRVSYAEFRQFLGPDGDGMSAPFGTDAHPWSRVDLFDPPDGRSTLLSPGKRELRYLALTLDGPGEVELDAIGVRQSTYPVGYDGAFQSSDELLNRAWYHSAHTGDLATLTEAGSPWMLTVTYDRILIAPDLHLQALAGYHQSSDHHWLVRNSLRRFARVQNLDGSFPGASSHLVAGDPIDGPPDGWRVPQDGPDPDVALGRLGELSLHRDMRFNSFTAFWVAALADHYRYTGDTALAREQLPVARRAMAFLLGRTDAGGLFVEPSDRRSDPQAPVAWVGNWSPVDLATGVDALTNAVLASALDGLALLEDEVGDGPSVAAAHQDRATVLRRALLDRLWDPTVGALVLNEDDPRRDHTADANAGALAFEALDPARASAAMDFLRRVLHTPWGTVASEYPDNPYRAHDIQGYLNALEALGRVRNGDGDGALALIRTWWGHMLAAGPGTGWFAWAADGSVEPGAFANTSWSTALPALSEGVLGVRPTEPGFRRWVVAPLVADLEWAQGRVPVPGAAALAVRWERAADRILLTVDVPEGTVGDVAVPLLGAGGDTNGDTGEDAVHEVAMDGELIWRAGRPVRGASAHRRGSGVLVRDVGAGRHTVAAVRSR